VRLIGLALVLCAVSAFALDALVLGDKAKDLAWNFPIPFWLSRSGNGAFWHAVPWPLAFLPLGLLGLGLVADAGTRRVRPDPKDAPIPLGRSGLVLAAIGLVWMVVSYFPHSNIPVILPTVRAERFWYFPALGTSLVIAVAFAWAHEALKARATAGRRQLALVVPAVFALFFGFQCVQAYRHAADYRNDLVFWEATKDAVPNSAKAHLNYSVMKGARGDLETRLVESKEAMRLAPEWPMAHIYTGDTLCRLHRAPEAWPHYKQGFAIGPNEQSLISLALQCLYDEKELYAHEKELRELAEAHPGSWIAYLAVDTLDNSEKHKGVDPKYRPRGYNEGPKE
jgi:tetratricopeptide (TPR) repeat protein